MTDLKNGILDFGDIVITKDTTRNDLMAVYGDKLSSISNDVCVRFKRLFIVSGHQFGCFFWFAKNGTIESIEMTPWIDYKSEDWDRTGKQEERRQFCDKWLLEQLGAPHEVSTNVTLYKYQACEVYSYSHFDMREGADAGRIVVRFSR